MLQLFCATMYSKVALQQDDHPAVSVTQLTITETLPRTVTQWYMV
jgi:hypothetical protein